MGTRPPLTAAAFAALAFAAGCASEGPAQPTFERPSYEGSSVVPEGVTEMRESLADQRAETVSRMEAARPEPVEMEADDGSDPFGAALDAFGWFAERTRQVLTLQAFGLW
jgi:hypothetical protein